MSGFEVEDETLQDRAMGTQGRGQKNSEQSHVVKNDDAISARVQRFRYSFFMLFAWLFFLAPGQNAFERIAAEARGHVGVAVRIVESGEFIGFRERERFPMQSVYKLPIAMAVLHAKLPLDQPVRVTKSDLVPAELHSPIRDAHPSGGFDMPLRELLRYAIAESDGTASDVLMRLVGGPAHVTEYLRGIGVKDIDVATTELEMSHEVHVQYRNWSTPEGMVHLLTKLSPQRDALLLKWMTESTPGPRRIKGLLPAGTIVAHKTGTSGTDSGITRATNDVGLITLPDGRHLAIAVFVSDSPADTATREAVIAKIARTAWDRFAR
jgi:beta-lactamase class A